MTRLRTTFLLAGLLAFFDPGAAWCLDLNAFFPTRGEGDAALSITAESYDEFWAGTRRTSAPGVGEVETLTATLWLRWGLTDRLALVANLPYVDVDSDGLGGFADSGLQDLSVLASYRLGTIERSNLRHVFAAAAGGRTPLSDYEGDAPVSLGDETTDVLARFVYQLEIGRLYFSQQIGFDLRGDDAPDGYPLVSELGYTAGRTTWTVRYQRYLADGGTDIGDSGFTFPSNREESERLALGVHARLGARLGLTAGGFTTLSGRNTGDATGFTVGLVTGF